VNGGQPLVRFVVRDDEFAIFCNMGTQMKQMGANSTLQLKGINQALTPRHTTRSAPAVGTQRKQILVSNPPQDYIYEDSLIKFEESERCCLHFFACYSIQ
jgi:hypothetical protein